MYGPNIENNLEQLLSQPSSPEEPVSQKVYVLGHAGVSRQKLCEALTLLQQASWTSYLAEKLHASCAHAYVAETMRKRQQINLQRRANSSRPPTTQQRVIQLHGRNWEAMDSDKRAAYEREARSMRSKAEAQLQTAFEDVTTELEVLQARAAGESSSAAGSHSTTMVLSEASWTSETMANTQQLLSDKREKANKLSKSQKKKAEPTGVTAPAPLAPADMEATSKLSMLDKPAASSYGAVAKAIMRQRYHFRHAEHVRQEPRVSP